MFTLNWNLQVREPYPTPKSSCDEQIVTVDKVIDYARVEYVASVRSSKQQKDVRCSSQQFVGTKHIWSYILVLFQDDAFIQKMKLRMWNLEIRSGAFPPSSYGHTCS